MASILSYHSIVVEIRNLDSHQNFSVFHLPRPGQPRGIALMGEVQQDQLGNRATARDCPYGYNRTWQFPFGLGVGYDVMLERNGRGKGGPCACPGSWFICTRQGLFAPGHYVAINV